MRHRCMFRVVVAAALLATAPMPSAAQAAGRPGAHAERCAELSREALRPQVLEERMRRDLALFDAARAGCVDLVRALLDHGASVHARNRFGSTPLHAAARAGALRVARVLIERGAEVDQPNLAGRTPLFYAVEHRRRRMVRFLLEHGADPARADHKGETPLAAAAFNGDLRTVRRLLSLGVPPDPVDSWGKSPITYAAARGFSRIVAALLEAGVDPTRRYGHDLTALMWAAGHTDGVPARDGLATVRILLDAGAPLDARDDRGMTALMIAAARGHREIAQLLLERGADPTLRDRQGRSAADHAKDPALRGLLEEAARSFQSAAR